MRVKLLVTKSYPHGRGRDVYVPGTYDVPVEMAAEWLRMKPGQTAPLAKPADAEAEAVARSCRDGSAEASHLEPSHLQAPEHNTPVSDEDGEEDLTDG